MKKILILSANPKGTEKLRLDEEMREIKQGLQLARNRDQFLIDSAEAVRPRDIYRSILNFEPQIIHFSGHGAGDEGLVFENDIGQPQLVDADALAGLFELFSNHVECVVLNACYSEIQAEAIAQHIDYVVGMAKAIGDKPAIDFAVGFYDALGAGKPVDFAYKLGCRAIRLAGIPEQLTPILKVKPDSSQSVVQYSELKNSISTKNNVVSTPSTEVIERTYFTEQNSSSCNNMRWDDKVGESAQYIIEAKHSPLRVLAGPGTGKTFVLKRHVARLLQNHIPPGRILVCTFTRTAATDLQKEISNLGIEGAKAVGAGTIHSFCFSLLSRIDVFQLTGRVPRPLLVFEERFLLEDLKDATLGGIRNCKKRLQASNAAWARSQGEQPGWPTDTIDQAFQHKLKSWLTFHKAMLIGELIPEALRFLRDNPASEDYQRFDHILIDEYQDLNRAEQELLDIIAKAGTLTVIGDEDQSIFSFKHAHPEGISTFKDSHPHTLDGSLEECRRCPSTVVEIANYFIANNLNRTPRILKPFANNPLGEVYIVQWQSAQQEAEGIARFIHKKVQEGEVQAGRILVLAPRRKFGYAVRDELSKLGTPARSFFQEEILDNDPTNQTACRAEQAFTLLTLLANPEDRVALRCWCGFGSDSLRSGAWERLRIHCEQSIAVTF
ncbi:UvrD-helicase domain-containing protein [Nostoc sp.]|uniref:UvrD-helicase domain-containing protein n=1 Tax=Nostoc sp. TaxID=1180 RepID=UPI002FF4ECCE